MLSRGSAEFLAKKALRGAKKAELDAELVDLFIATCKIAQESSMVYLSPQECLNVAENLIMHPHGRLDVLTAGNPAATAQLLAMLNFARERGRVPKNPSFFSDMRA